MSHNHLVLGLTLLLATLFSANTLAANKLYKWTDEAGNVHYSEKPPSDRTTDVVISDTQPKAETVSPDTTPLEIPQATDQEAARQLAERCQSLYHELERYQTRAPIADGEGNVMVISEEMREAKLISIKAELDQFCR
ncbi:MAG: DUF4124 domain-containing protein [Gammaproteobacteria bacterium]|nr:DUF4124 domain-containing protein [Gammaproteobacteria bacterium]